MTHERFLGRLARHVNVTRKAIWPPALLGILFGILAIWSLAPWYVTLTIWVIAAIAQRRASLEAEALVTFVVEVAEDGIKAQDRARWMEASRDRLRAERDFAVAQNRNLHKQSRTAWARLTQVSDYCEALSLPVTQDAIDAWEEAGRPYLGSDETKPTHG